jgi:hypothetical protein
MATSIGMGYVFWMSVSFVFQGFNVLNDAAAGSGTECREREKICRRQETRIGSIPYPPSVFERSGTRLLPQCYRRSISPEMFLHLACGATKQHQQIHECFAPAS